jgi:hypothetical protein
MKRFFIALFVILFKALKEERINDIFPKINIKKIKEIKENREACGMLPESKPHILEKRTML